jgi:Rieske Fe-S protein
MTRGVARVAFVCAAVLAAGVVGAAGFASLTPKPVPIGNPMSIAIAKLSALREREPQYVLAAGLSHLKAEARRDRGRGGPYPMMGAQIDVKGDLGLYVVRYDGTARAFIASDPRNGCRLNVDYPGIRLADGVLAFHDVCHGSLYDVNGERLGGPSPWALDELVVAIRDGVVYVDRSKVLPGRLLVSWN